MSRLSKTKCIKKALTPVGILVGVYTILYLVGFEWKILLYFGGPILIAGGTYMYVFFRHRGMEGVER